MRESDMESDITLSIYVTVIKFYEKRTYDFIQTKSEIKHNNFKYGLP